MRSELVQSWAGKDQMMLVIHVVCFATIACAHRVLMLEVAACPYREVMAAETESSDISDRKGERGQLHKTLVACKMSGHKSLILLSNESAKIRQLVNI